MQKYVIGVDVGTSGTKSILVSETGAVIASATAEYPLYTPKTGWAEQDPHDWWAATVDTVRRILAAANVPKSSIVGLGLSGQMHGLVALDRDMHVIRPSILWCDQRTQKQCDDTVERAGGLDALLKLTNNRMLTGYTGSKLLWMRENEPTLFTQIHVFMNPKDYIRFMLTGEVATEVSDASGTGLFNVKERVWSDKIINILGLPKSIFPKCVESADVVGRVTPLIASETGLPVGLPVVGGGGDAVIQTTGTGIVQPGILGVVIGTSGVVAMGLSEYKPNVGGGKLQLFCNNAPDLWHAMGVTLAAGGSYRWYRDTLCEGEGMIGKQEKRSAYAIMDERAGQAAPGSNGLVFLPYLIGERCPHADPNARGGLFGLTLNHTKNEMNRAVMEGVTFSLKQVADLINGLDSSIQNTKIITSGGGATSKVWRQMQADIFKLPVYTLSGSGEGGAYGAALVAGVGCGIWDKLSDTLSVLKVETETLPNRDNFAAYDDAFKLYSDLYGLLKPAFDYSAETWK